MIKKKLRNKLLDRNTRAEQKVKFLHKPSHCAKRVSRAPGEQ